MKQRLTSAGVVRVPEELFSYTHESLREYSRQDVEAMALWAGDFVDHGIFEVMAVRVPMQKAIQTGSGLAVIIEADELHRLNVWLHEQQLRLIAQLHTHPGPAYHSGTDDAIPIMATRGGLSLVIPDFARGPADFNTYAVYRLGPEDRWDAVSEQAVDELLELVPTREEQ